ncbi:MAG: hypothetical protein JO101_04665 [Candidatus Eremiobacteraeota bacterium]|nr:hypothetical protein [Candidatus Eremiobacteraeota bacterium]MBV8354591.1 hypothetical protein [Candidatus Eremiobacteraeota bacterium]
MNGHANREIVVVDLIGELDAVMCERLESELKNLERPGVVWISFERLDSTHSAPLADVAAALDKLRRAGVDIRVDARLRRARAVLDGYAIPCQTLNGNGFSSRRRLIIARTPQVQVTAA